MTVEQLYELFLKSTGISTDTRKIEKGTIFFAIKGENFDGNKFAVKALELGSDYAIVDQEIDSNNNNKLISVNNVLKTLQNLANYHRKQFDIPVIGITGSNGKTTSKELIGAVLGQSYNVLMTKGNLNNHLGVPFTLLNLNQSHEIAIIEMGANKPGDIKELVEIAEPSHGIITNIGTAHIEGFGSLEGVIKTKTELYDFLRTTHATVFCNNEDSTLMAKISKDINLVTYGNNNGDVSGKLELLTPFVQFNWAKKGYQSKSLSTKLVGKYNFTNFLAAICIGNYFNVEADKISEALVNYTPSNNRSQVDITKRNTLIVDCYNANPSSMKSALDSFFDIDSPNKIVILGDMLELGNVSSYEHQAIVELTQVNNVQSYFVGKEFKKTSNADRVYSSVEELQKQVDLSSINDCLVLLKGSRGIKLETIIPYL